MNASGLNRLTRATVDAVTDFLAVDDDWVRPAPTRREQRRDLAIAAGWLAFVLFGMELLRSAGFRPSETYPLWAAYAVAALGAAPLVIRRRFPLTMTVLTQLHLFVAGLTMPGVMGQFPLQLLYFFALFSGVAYARDRRAMLLVIAVDLVLMFSWLTYTYAVDSAIADMLRQSGVDASDHPGLFSPAAAAVIWGFVVNICYFGGAVLFGQNSWRRAAQLAQVSDQARTISAQAAELTDRAVVEERLRIARELHDVVAHHVSLMGIQAAAARRVLATDPGAASSALRSVEESSRGAVGEMRHLLGTLRGLESAPSGWSGAAGAVGSVGAAGTPTTTDRSPGPSIPQIPDLVAASARPGVVVTYDLVEAYDGAVDVVPAHLGLALYRIVQEALSNVRVHSTARHVGVVARVDRRYVEVEVVDDGRPKGGTSGTGLGLVGMRERITGHGGTLDAGPRVTGGYRVRVRFPLISDSAPARRVG